MAKPFLKLIAEHLHNHYKDSIEKVCIVLPGKRGALFLKKYLGEAFSKTTWLPKIISAEDLIAELSHLKILEEIDLICHLYESYRIIYTDKAEPFESFAKWGQLILQDFNEIDRYLADPEQLYENLKDIKVIENWSLGEENLSEFQINYLEFMSSLGAIYKHYTHFLIEHNWAYQGLAYRMAVKNLNDSTYFDNFQKIIFCGFNALNSSELKIFDHLYKQHKAELIWDIDDYYYRDLHHEAGLFLRKNLEFFGQKDPSFILNHLSEPKDIEIISVPKQIGQAQVVRQTIEKHIRNGVPLDKVAVVLANEKLLWPVLQLLPPEVKHVNVTMEYPLRYTSSYALIDTLLQIQINYAKQTRTVKHLYYKDLFNVLKLPLFITLINKNNPSFDANKIISEVSRKNLSFISEKELNRLLGTENSEFIKLLIETKDVRSYSTLLNSSLERLSDHFLLQERNNVTSLEIEFLGIFIRNFNKLEEVLEKYQYFSDIRSFKQLFNQIVGNSSAPFIGEPLKGLQIMGVLETRTLDFEHLIIINVNESVLPSGKSINSFIPNDLKRAFGLPLYVEKDAIYSYHFYRLLQRASDITLTYDSETDTFGKGEKSRFITQLQLELPSYNRSAHIIEKAAATTKIDIGSTSSISISKNHSTLDRIINKAITNDQYGGFSPSSLIVFIDCSLKFYFRYGAGLKESKDVEESAEANTFGSILHLSLEHLYKDLIGKTINGSDLLDKVKDIESVVDVSFREFFAIQELTGKTLLQFEVIKAYIEKFIKYDHELLSEFEERNEKISILELEKEFGTELELNINGVHQKVYFKGKIDRIDRVGNTFRLIDYKTSTSKDDSFEFSGFHDLFILPKYNKQLQLIMYAWLLQKNNYCNPEQMSPCIISFKELKTSTIHKKDRSNLIFTTEFLQEFETHLIGFIQKIFSKEQDFVQTSDHDICKYCDYNTICNKIVLDDLN